MLQHDSKVVSLQRLNYYTNLTHVNHVFPHIQYKPQYKDVFKVCRRLQTFCMTSTLNKLKFSVIWQISTFTNATNKFWSSVMTGLADVDGFKLFVQVCVWLRFPSLNFRRWFCFSSNYQICLVIDVDKIVTKNHKWFLSYVHTWRLRQGLTLCHRESPQPMQSPRQQLSYIIHRLRWFSDLIYIPN